MRRWVAVGLGIIALIVFGLSLWWPPGASPDRLSDLGTALIGGSVAALVALYLERVFSKESEKHVLQLQLGFAKNLTGMDLRGLDLSGLYLPGKEYVEANLSEANL